MPSNGILSGSGCRFFVFFLVLYLGKGAARASGA